MIKVGCCGLPKPLKEYAVAFPVVEIQQTFYKPPKIETARRWREQVPDEFEFLVKAWQLITHEATSPTYRKANIRLSPQEAANCGSFRPTQEVMRAWQATRAIAEALSAPLILFQCPASFRPTEENIANMRTFFRIIDRGPFLLAWEPRGAWNEATIRQLCSSLVLVHCVDPFETKPVHDAVRYFRLHGGPGYRHQYSEDELAWLLEACRGLDAYVMFNNIPMYEDAQRFQSLVHHQKQNC